MAENNDKPNLGSGEISTIRNILMGEQMALYEERFKLLQNQSAQNDAGTRAALENLDARWNERFSILEKSLNARLDKIEKTLADSVAKLDQKVENTSKKDKERVGKLLSDLGQKLGGV